MSSDLFAFENSFFSDPFSAFADSAIDDSLPYDEIGAGLIRGGGTTPFDQISAALLSSSPPSFQLENLTLMSQLGSAAEYSAPEEVKTEEFQLSFDADFSGFGNCFSPQSLDETAAAAAKFMQRSFSSNSFENRPSFCFRPRFDGVLESQSSPKRQILSSPPEFSSGQMRRVCSTGDLQKVQMNMQTKNAALSVSPLSSEKSLMEDANFKVGKYSAEERKEKIDRYRAKRTQRNFHKTIKYACRKTLADNRPRIRGRFARNDEAGEIPKPSTYEDEDDFWMDGFHEEGMLARRGELFNITGSTQYQNYSY
ncbi:hypothetical protein ABFX02_01G072200 [Erythranthe guttata]